MPPPSSKSRRPTTRGSFASDRANGYSLHWPTWQDFEVWLKREQRDHGIEFVRKNIRKAGPNLPWMERHEFVCTRQGAGSAPRYTPKHPERKRNVPSKRSGCPCRLTVKTYPGSQEVLGMYNEEHTHDIGNENLRFTRLSKEVRDRIVQLLQLGVENEQIVCKSILNLASRSLVPRLRLYVKSNQGRDVQHGTSL
jgi:hypothetical protein